MTIHFLDIIMYVVLSIILYIVAPEQYKHEMGILIWFSFQFVFTIVYLILFAALGLDWIDLFNSLSSSFKNGEIKVTW